MSTDYSQTGPISNWAKPSAPLAPAVQVRSDFPPAPGLVSTGPDGKELPPDQWYDTELGSYFMAYWTAEHIERCRETQRQNRRQMAQDEALADARRKANEPPFQSRVSPDGLTQEAVDRIAALEARCAVLEAKIERLTMPTRIGSRSRPKASRAAQEGGDLPPAA
jgi:uncharacterized small protein (DUF1192 family)